MYSTVQNFAEMPQDPSEEIQFRNECLRSDQTPTS